MLFSFSFNSWAAANTTTNPIEEFKTGWWRVDSPNIAGDTASMNRIMSKHKARIDLLFYNLNLPAEYSVIEAYKFENGASLFLTDVNGQIYYVEVDDSGVLDYFNASRAIVPGEDYKKIYPNREWQWENITLYLVGTKSLAENKAVPGNAFLPLANITLTTEVKVGNKLTDCQNIIAGPADNPEFPFVNFWYGGALNGEWRNSVLNVIADCTTPGDAVAVKSVTDLQTIGKDTGLMIEYVRWDGHLCQTYLVKIDKNYDNTERWKQRFSDSQIITKPSEFISEAEFTDWSYLLPKGSYHPENGIASYPRIDLDFRKNSEGAK